MSTIYCQKLFSCFRLFIYHHFVYFIELAGAFDSPERKPGKKSQRFLPDHPVNVYDENEREYKYSSKRPAAENVHGDYLLQHPQHNQNYQNPQFDLNEPSRDFVQQQQYFQDHSPLNPEIHPPIGLNQIPQEFSPHHSQESQRNTPPIPRPFNLNRFPKKHYKSSHGASGSSHNQNSE